MTKNAMTPVTKKIESGMSLISLMVSIALSSVTMLAATHMHTSHQLAVNELDDSIRHNRLVLTSLKVIEKEVLSAGYGIAGADADDIITQFVPADTVNLIPAVRSLLWRFNYDFNSDGTDETECRALIESGVYVNGIEHRFLTLRRAPDLSAACNTSTPLADITMNETIGRLGEWEVKGELVSHVSASNTLFSFQLQTDNCSFPGLRNPQDHMSATIRAPNSAELNGHGFQNGITVCLTNISP